MLRIVNLEEIQGCLMDISNLTDMLEQRQPELVEKVIGWLSRLEAVLVSNRNPLSADISTLRAILISSQRGAIPEGIQIYGQVSKGKILHATISNVLYRANYIISNSLSHEAERISSAQEIMQQIVAVAKWKGVIPSAPSGTDHTEYLNLVWNSIINDQDLQSAAIKVLGQVGAYDALILLDRAIVNVV